MKKLFYALTMLIGCLCCSCNSYLDKPIYEPLTVEELKKAFEKDPMFEYDYSEIEEAAKAINENTILKVKFSDLTYRKMIKTMRYLRSDAFGEVYASFGEEWKNYAMVYQSQVDSIVGYWKHYIEEMNQLAKIEPIKIRKEYYSFGSLKSVELGFRITSLKEQLKYIRFQFSIVSKADKKEDDDSVALPSFGLEETCFAFIDSPSTVEYADVGYAKREILENYDIKTFLDNYNVIIEVKDVETVEKEYDLYEVPSCVRLYLNDEDDGETGMENHWFGDIVKECIDEKFIDEFDFVEKKRTEFLSKQYPLYWEFVNSL